MVKRKNKIRVGILFGGKSAEHEISIQSAQSIVKAIGKTRYEPVLIYIDKKGQWNLLQNSTPPFWRLPKGRGKIQNSKCGGALAVVPGKNELVDTANSLVIRNIDIVFPALHGPFGEDGTIQGLLKLVNIPFVGAGVLGSAVGMDKEVAKRLMRDAGIPAPRFIVLRRYYFRKTAETVSPRINFNEVKKYLGLPFFVKPANLGSSVGVSKVKNEKQFRYSLKEAFRYDNKILAEEYIKGREIECAILGNEDPIASIPGEILPQHEFYSYEAKYLDKNGAFLKIPAELPKSVVKKIQDLSIKTFKALECEGMARVDFFLRNDEEIFVSEINTIPGFTKISMYPKLWEASGVSYKKLIDELICLAIRRFRGEQKLKTSYLPR